MIGGGLVGCSILYHLCKLGWTDAILLERDELEQAAALAPRLSRLGLLEDDDVRYALAYAHFRTGELDLAEEELKGITKRELFSRATDLRKAIEAERAEEAR